MTRPPRLPCFHPSTWIFLDDEQRFLESLDVFLPDDQPAEFYFDVNSVRSRMHDSRKPIEDYQSLLKLENLELYLSSEERFSKPAILVVDYAMPQIDGISLCQEFIDYPTKKILLTGVADESDASFAFNEGLISRYISKGGRNALSEIVSFGSTLSEEYMRSIFSMSLWQAEEMSVCWGSISTLADLTEWYYCDEPIGICCVSRDGRIFFVNVEGEIEERNTPAISLQDYLSANKC